MKEEKWHIPLEFPFLYTLNCENIGDVRLIYLLFTIRLSLVICFARFMVTTIPEEEHHAEVKRRESAVDPKDLPGKTTTVVGICGEDEQA